MTRNCVRTKTRITTILSFTLKACKMNKQYNLLIKFFINLSLISYVIATQSESSHTSPTPDEISAPTDAIPILPLTLIHSAGSYHHPTSFGRTITNDDVLCNGTLFKTTEEENQQFFCPREGTEEHTSHNSEYLYPKTFQDPYEILKCSTEATPMVKKITHLNDSSDTDKEIICGSPEKKGKWFTVGYMFCTSNQTTNVERSDQSPENTPIPRDECIEFKIFEFCYSEEDYETIFTNHIIRSPGLLHDHRLRHEREKQYEMNTDGYNYFGRLFEDYKNKYDNMEIPIESKSPTSDQAFSSSTSAFIGQKLTPHEDFPFALWKKPTYHFFNVMPMHKTLIQLWNYINDCLRANAIKKNEEYAIHTGGFPLSDLSNTDFIAETITIPDIWIKIAYRFDVEKKEGTVSSNRTEALAIVLNNNLNNEIMSQFNNQYCKINLCEDAFKLEFPEVGNSARCCAVGIDEDIQTLFHVHFRVDDVLHIDFSTNM